MEGRQKEYGNETTTDTEDAIKPGRVENEVSEGPVVVNLQINVDSHNNQNSVSIAEKGRKRIRKSGEVGQLKKKKLEESCKKIEQEDLQKYGLLDGDIAYVLKSLNDENVTVHCSACSDTIFAGDASQNLQKFRRHTNANSHMLNLKRMQCRSSGIPTEFTSIMKAIDEKHPGEFTYNSESYGEIRCNSCFPQAIIDIKSQRGGTMNRVNNHLTGACHKASKKAKSNNSKIESFFGGKSCPKSGSCSKANK